MRQEETITVRVEPALKQKIKALERGKAETASNIIREALVTYVQKEAELREMRNMVAERFAAERISFEEAVRLLGYEEAKKIAFFVETARKSFEKGLK